MRRLTRLSISKKVLLFFLCFAVFGVVVPFVTLYYHYVNTFKNSSTESIELLLYENEQNFIRFLDTVSVAIDQINNNNTAQIIDDKKVLSPVTEMIVEFDQQSDLYDLQLKLTSNKVLMKSLFDSVLGFMKNEEEFSYALIIDDKYPISKYLPYWEDNSAYIFCRSNNMENCEWYQTAIEKDGENYWFTDSAFPDRICVARILSYQQVSGILNYEKHTAGVIMINFDMSWFAQKMNDSEITRNALVYLIDTDRKVLYENQVAECFTEEDVSSLLQIAGDGSLALQEYKGEKYLIRQSSVGQGLVTLSVIPFTNIEGRVLEMTRIILLWMIVSIVFVILFTIFMKKNVFNPILLLTLHMKRNVLEPIDGYEERTDEIGFLYRNYNQSLIYIQQLIEEIYVNMEKRNKAEIHALQIQINPHFIYNTLGTIACSALLEGKDEIAEQITALSTIIRYNVKNPDDLVCVKEELAMLHCYESIYRMCYKDRLQFSYNVDPKCMEVKVPKMLIQPLIENGIQHGVDFQDGAGQISVSIAIEEADLIIRVANNGRTMNTEMFNKYIQALPPMDNKDSLGVRNVYDRIKLRFGDNGEMSYRINEAGHTEAVIIIHRAEMKIP